MSLTELTTAAGWIAGLAILSMIAAGWRKPARANADPARALRSRSGRAAGVPVEEAEVVVHRRTPIWRKVWALAAGSTLAVVTGAILATVLAGGIAVSVVTLTNMLRR